MDSELRILTSEAETVAEIQMYLAKCHLPCEIWPRMLMVLRLHGLYCTRKQIGTHREKKHVLTLTLMLVRRKSACKTSAGSSKIFRWLAPLLGPNLDPKTGPKQRLKTRNENVIQFWAPFWGPYLEPKMGQPSEEFRCCPQMFCKQICDPAA